MNLKARLLCSTIGAILGVSLAWLFGFDFHFGIRALWAYGLAWAGAIVGINVSVFDKDGKQ